MNPSNSLGVWPLRRVVILAVTLAMMALTASLGAWQMRRAAFKQTLAAQIEAKNQLGPLSNSDLLGSNIAAATLQQDWLHRRVSLQGRWLHQYTVFLDNRPMQVAGGARVGFYVATPLLLAGERAGAGQVVWVQRGWVPRDFQDRNKLPTVAQAEGVVTVSGRLMEHVSRAFEMQTPAATASGAVMSSRIWQNLPAVDFSPQSVLPFAVFESEALSADGLLRNWPAADTGVAKHHGYAFQWFALCGTLFILYVWFQLIAPRRHRLR